MKRRDFLLQAAAASAGAVGASAATGAERVGHGSSRPTIEGSPPLACGSGLSGIPYPFPLVRARPDRITTITVCTRPFREQGPRIETEKVGRKTIVHNYGHGGTGWSLSWGSAEIALRQVLATRESEIAVIGCGVIGLTSALAAQRAGLKVRIYAKDRPPEVRSTFATGNWSPGSRYCTADGATPDVLSLWEEMTRISFRKYQFMLGLPGAPVEWRDGYYLSDPSRGTATSAHGSSEPAYPPLESRLSDIALRAETLLPGTHPFPTEIARRFPVLVFNISALMHLYMSDFVAAGGVIETREFVKPSDISKLREKVVMNCTGYGARALFGDESVIPVRGQMARLIPQPEVNYALQYGSKFYMLARPDALILQTQAPDDYGSESVTPDRAAAERAVLDLAELNDRIRAFPACSAPPPA